MPRAARQSSSRSPFDGQGECVSCLWRLLAGLVLLVTVMFTIACGSGVMPSATTATTASSGGSTYSCKALADALKAAGLSVSTTDGGSSPPFEGMATHARLLADGATVEVFTFPTAAAASAAASQVDTGGTGYPQADGNWIQVEWVGSPHVFARDRLIVIYVEEAQVGTSPAVRAVIDQSVLQTLRSQMGEEFAGATQI